VSLAHRTKKQEDEGGKLQPPTTDMLDRNGAGVNEASAEELAG